MRKLLLLLSLTALFCFLQLRTYATFKVVGYMPSWAGSVSSIQYSKLTHINYAFILPQSDGTLKPMPNQSKLNSLVSNGHANGVKVLIAIGGWNIGGPGGDGDDTPFRLLAADPVKRKKFVDTVMSIVYHYNLDGVDIDWEYPNGSEASSFTSLMTELGDTLHSVNKLLTAAVYAGGGVANDISDDVLEIVDFLNIMAYDNCCGGSHSTLLFGKSSLDYWTIDRGMDPDKAVLGVPFYGRSPYMSYSSIIASDATAKDRDYYIQSGNTIWYNGIATIKSKANYAKTNGGGIMIWELSQDASGANSLLSAIYDVTPVFTPVSNDFNVEIFPNPADDFILISSTIRSGYPKTKILMYDAMGVLVKEEEVSSEEGMLNVAELLPGVYMLKLECGDQVAHSRFIKK